MAVSLILTWIVPSGEFQTEVVDGREVVVPGSYTESDEKILLSPLSLFTVIPRALADAQGIIFFVLIIGGALAVIRDTGAIDAFLGATVERFRELPGLLIFISMFLFAFASATLGMAEEYIPFAVLLVSLCVALKMDSITAIGTLVVGYCIGYGVAFLNPFTVLIAQDIAELTPASGMGFRLAIAGPFLAVGFHHVWRYARKVQDNPTRSLVYDIEEAQPPQPESYPAMTGRRIVVLITLILALVGLVLGIYYQGWYLVELGGMFIALTLVTGIISNTGMNKTAVIFGKGAAELTSTALLIGFARAIALLMEDGEILHTIVNTLAAPLVSAGAEIAAIGMLFIQSMLNFFIPSGSGQAFVTMPLMVPIGDIVGVSRQISVLAFQFGDGLMNMIVPTNAVLMGILGLSGIPYDRWFRFILPLVLKLLLLGAIVLVIAVQTGYR